MKKLKQIWRDADEEVKVILIAVAMAVILNVVLVGWLGD